MVLTFQFAAGLALGETLNAPTATITVLNGTDALASTRFGTPQKSGTDVLIKASGCLDGVDYHVKIVVTTSNTDKVLALAKVLPVRAV